MEFFVDETLKKIEIDGKKFKYKPTTAGDELEWHKDISVIEEMDMGGERVQVQRTDTGKLALCKLRNIVEVPFTDAELKKITGLDKPYSEYTGPEKDKLFRKLSGDVFNELIKQIDGLRTKKKS